MRTMDRTGLNPFTKLFLERDCPPWPAQFGIYHQSTTWGYFPWSHLFFLNVPPFGHKSTWKIYWWLTFRSDNVFSLLGSLSVSVILLTIGSGVVLEPWDLSWGQIFFPQKRRAGKWKSCKSYSLHCEKNTLDHFCPINYHDSNFAFSYFSAFGI